MKNLWKGINNILNINKKKDFHISELGKNINNKDMAKAFNEFPNVYLPPRIPHSLPHHSRKLVKSFLH